jgi:hypothetical protein
MAEHPFDAPEAATCEDRRLEAALAGSTGSDGGLDGALGGSNRLLAGRDECDQDGKKRFARAA